jgi:hypothetical protein
LDTATYLLIATVVWLFSGIVVTAMRANDEFLDGLDVAVTAAFGPITFVIMAFWLAYDRVMPVWRRLKRRVKDRLAGIRWPL